MSLSCTNSAAPWSKLPKNNPQPDEIPRLSRCRNWYPVWSRHTSTTRTWVCIPVCQTGSLWCRSGKWTWIWPAEST